MENFQFNDNESYIYHCYNLFSKCPSSGSTHAHSNNRSTCVEMRCVCFKQMTSLGRQFLTGTAHKYLKKMHRKYNKFKPGIF